MGSFEQYTLKVRPPPQVERELISLAARYGVANVHFNHNTIRNLIFIRAI
jgi:hypothetical protein